MEGGSLQYLVDKVVHFFVRTLKFANLAGPFTEAQLERMFTEAHFCSDLTFNPALSEDFQPIIQNLRERFVLETAPQQLLMNLADNLKVNKESLIKAKNLFDRGVDDLESSLVLMPRHSAREKFLEISQKLKSSSPEGWEKLRDYMKFVDFHKRGEIDKEKMIKCFPEKVLKFLVLEDPNFSEMQSSLTASLQNYLSVEQLLKCCPAVTAAAMTSSPGVRRALETKLIRHLNTTEVDIISLRQLAQFLCDIVKNCEKEVVERFLATVENNLTVLFVKEELINFMTVKMKYIQSQ